MHTKIYGYDKTLTPKKVSEDLSVPERILHMRKAAEAHKHIRLFIKDKIKPGTKLLDVANMIENKSRELLGDDLEGGVGFPTGLSINNIAAHDSAWIDDKRVLKKTDVCKIDIGCQKSGYIIDSAFTLTFDPQYDQLVQASREATMSAIKLAGPDVLINDLSKEIKEVIESHEIDLNGKTFPIHAINSLGGHNIERYKIHGGKLVLCVPNKGYEERMTANECFAIETFATTGNGDLSVNNDMQCTHFGLNGDAEFKNFKFKITGQVYNYIKKNRSTLPFSNRWLYEKFGKQFNLGLQELVKAGVVKSYPVLTDKPGTLVSQMEHTIFLHDFGKEILSQGDDY